MKIYKFQYLKNLKSGSYVFYALGEILLIIVGILSALFINNWYAEKAYHHQIDKNITRVYEELEGNIAECKSAIIEFRMKDSLIYRVMADSVTASDYKNNLSLSYLILSYNNTNINDKAFENLIEINNSENLYQENLINELKDVYELYEYLERDNNTMHEFVYNEVMNLIMKNTSSFGNLAYSLELNEDMINFFLTSDIYKSLVSKYSILAIRNQLRLNQLFYKRALSVYSEIADNYELENIYYSNQTKELTKYEGQYINSKTQEAYDITLVNNNLYLVIDSDYKLKLIPIEKGHFFIDHDTGSFFVTFYSDQNNQTKSMSINLLSKIDLFEKTNKVNQ